MNSDLSMLTLIINATLIAQIVMAILLAVSIGSWTTIFRKWLVIRSARSATDGFEETFWSGGELANLYQRVSGHTGKTGKREDFGPLARIFEAGMREFGKSRSQRPDDLQGSMDSARRAMRAAYQREMDSLEASLAFLASAGSVSPYIGLFGTVWGIMHAFRGLSNVQQATLANVAPGIAEALVATAIGLFAAIPAVIAYNTFAHDIDRISNKFETFIEEFSNILQRQSK